MSIGGVEPPTQPFLSSSSKTYRSLGLNTAQAYFINLHLDRYRRALFSYTTSTDPPFTLRTGDEQSSPVMDSWKVFLFFFPFILFLLFHLASKTALLIENPSRWGCRKSEEKAFRQEIFKAPRR
ncbi:hypothetical protein CEXT_435511 [Caerostris extrusa]|uniref:Uncharacterized protein n=1 Tax=Caerostris extrusa TaxID=172846 RepID=A0AAV4R1Q1_CAEEX|nr:hypothetical protein CEXT_435511 [Caerostris extrusa]